jgi:hypothetical protein
MKKPSLYLAIALLFSPFAQGQPVDSHDLSRFQRTALSVQDTDQEQRQRFARQAMLSLYEVYSSEADLARSQADALPNRDKLLGWSAAVDEFARQILEALSELDSGADVAIYLSRQSIVTIDVAGRFVMLTHPRHSQKSAFEQLILDQFCASNDCITLTGVANKSLQSAMYYGNIVPQWQFSNNGASCSHEGVQIAFTGTSGLVQLKETCRQFFSELNSLLTEITWQQMHGVRADWGELAIRPTPGKTEHFVSINASGDTVLAALPLLYAASDLLTELTPWLQSRSAGGKAVPVLVDGRRWQP